MSEESIKKLLLQFRKKRNVIGGSLVEQPREKDGKMINGTKVLRIYVTKKENECLLTNKDLLPTEVSLDGIKIEIDVVEIGDIKALDTVPLSEEKPDPKLKYRPLMMGISTMNGRSTGGCSLGTFAKDNISGKILQLSNQHCFGLENDALSGDPIIQPSACDTGTSNDKTGNFVRGVDIKFAEFSCDTRNILHKLYRAVAGTPVNIVDVSCADIENTVSFVLKTPDGTEILGTHDPIMGQLPWAYGRSSGYSHNGEYIDLAGFVTVGYRRGNAIFQDVVIGKITPTFSCIPGDSGSPWFEGNALCGLRFAGSDTTWIGCKWSNITQELQVEFLV